MPESKRIQSYLEDVEIIHNLSKVIWERLESDFPLWSNSYNEFKWIQSKNDCFPKKIYFKDSRNQIYSVIVSEIGSLTLLPENEKKQPIFYMSLYKFEGQGYLWVDSNYSEIKWSDLPKLLESAIQNLRSHTNKDQSKDI